MPSAIRRGIRAADILNTGEVRNPYSRKLIYRPANRYTEAQKTLIGFPSLEMQRERAADQVAARVKARFLENRTEAAREIALNIIRGNREEARRLTREANAFGLAIDQRTIQRHVRELQRPAAERRRRRTPVVLREELEDLF